MITPLSFWALNFHLNTVDHYIANSYIVNLIVMIIRYVSRILCGLPSDPVNYENRLLRDLLDDYNRHARPIADVHSAIDVYISFYLTKILGLVSTRIFIYFLFVLYVLDLWLFPCHVCFISGRMILLERPCFTIVKIRLSLYCHNKEIYTYHRYQNSSKLLSADVCIEERVGLYIWVTYISLKTSFEECIRALVNL